MANFYKTIGSSTAAVVSILAIGTALWFQRTPGPINAPQTQDEAEVATAILERHSLMGRTAAGFFKSVWNGRYQTNVTETVFVGSITFSNGASSPTNHYFLGNTNTSCYFDVPPTGTYTVVMYYTSGTFSEGTLRSGGTLYASSAGSGYLVADGPECEPSFLQWYSEGLGTEFLPVIDGEYTDPTVWGSYDYSYSLTTNSTTNLVRLYDVDTNSIGFCPSAPSRYASAIRAAFMGRHISGRFSAWYGNPQINLSEWYVSGVGASAYAPPQETANLVYEWDVLSVDNTTVGWIVPENEYMDSGSVSWFGASIHSNVFSCPPNYWIKWDAMYDDVYGTSWEEFADKWQARQKAVWTNYVTKEASSYRTSGTYHVESVYTQIVGSVTNISTGTVYVVSNTIAYASVNTYAKSGADMFEGVPECVAMMFPFERDTPNIGRVDANRVTGFSGVPAGKYHPAFWSTNVYRDMGRALSMLQWVRDYRQPTTNIYWMLKYTNGALQEASSTTGFSVASPHIETYFYVSSRTNSWAWGTTVLYDFTNSTPFNLDTILFQPTYYTNANAGDYGAGPDTVSAVPTNSSGSAGWWPLDPDELRTLLDDHAQTATATTTGKYLHADIPYDCYHVQFSALTNYLDHAPAR